MTKTLRFTLAVAVVLACARPAPGADAVSTSRRNAITEAARRVSPAVVSVVVTQTRIVSYDPFGGFGIDEFFRDFFPRRQFREEVRSMGSGFVISADGDVITNAHVVRNATAIKVTLPDNREFEADLAGLDNGLDLALLRVRGQDLPTAPLGTADDLLIGEWVIAFGNPFGFMLQDAQPTVTVGVISALHRDVRTGRGQVMSDMVQTDAAINPGNSGGPLTNADGEVIGVNTFIFSHSGGSEGIGFARPIDAVREFVADVKGAGGTRLTTYRTALGAEIADLTAVLRARFNLSHNRGVVVLKVTDGSAGARIGLRPGDVILMAQGKAVRAAADFARQFERLDSTINIVVDRDGESTRLYYRLR
ncbi:MAG: trypsin-like peptidase domain-containing protein [bacterium]